MTKLRISAVLGVVAGLTAGAAYFYSHRPAATGDLSAVTRPAPDWKLLDLDGREVSSAQFKGKVMVVDFWATWCAPCIYEIPGYAALQEKYGKDGLVIVGVSMDNISPERVKQFAEANGVNYLIVQGDDAVAEAFGGLIGLPTTFLISRHGRIVHSKTGALPHDEYEKLVKRALN